MNRYEHLPTHLEDVRPTCPCGSQHTRSIRTKAISVGSGVKSRPATWHLRSCRACGGRFEIVRTYHEFNRRRGR